MVLFREGHLPQVLWCWEGINIVLLAGDDVFSLTRLDTHIDEPNLIAIGAIGIANLQRIGIEFSLPHTFRHVFLVTLCLNHCQFHTLVFKDIISLLRILIASSRDASRRNISTLLH